MSKVLFDTVTLVGSGVVGRGWIHVFTAAGCKVRMYDKFPEALEKCTAWFKDSLVKDVVEGFYTQAEADKRSALYSVHSDLAEALTGAGYMQESVSENLDLKKELYAEMDNLAAPHTILASSTSALNVDDFTGSLPGASRCIMSHPFNPPHVLPAVEVLGNKKTTEKVMEDTILFLTQVGQKPVRLNFFVPGFIGNRIQTAILREAIHLVDSGVADAEAVDTLLSDAMGLRYALFGNFGVNNTNADGGIRMYYKHLGDMYVTLSKELDSTPPSFDPALVEKIGQQVDKMEGGATPEQLCEWRNLVIRKIRQLKVEFPHPGGRK